MFRFEFIKIEDIKSLCTHVVENFSPTLDKITYVQTFKALKMRLVLVLRVEEEKIVLMFYSGMINIKTG